MSREPVKFKIAYLMLPSGAVPETFATSFDDKNFDENLKRFHKRWPEHLNAVVGFVVVEHIPGEIPE